MSNPAAELCSVLGELLAERQRPPSSSDSFQYVAIAPGWFQVRLRGDVARRLFGQLVQSHGPAPDTLRGHDAKADHLSHGRGRP